MYSWQRTEWPNFSFEYNKIAFYEAEFLKKSGICFGAITHMSDEDKHMLKVEILSDEALKTSKIEGEILDRDSIQVSICKQFGLETDHRKIPPKEKGIAGMMLDLYHTFHEPLKHSMLFRWHKMVLAGRTDIKTGQYRDSKEPTQVVTGRLDNPKIHFEAPPSNIVRNEMDQFVHWFNETSPGKKGALSPLIRSGLAHLYFVLIHPFEDGNGRIARAIAEKALAQSIEYPSLIALSFVIERYRKDYYYALEDANKQIEVTRWLEYFAQTILDAQEATLKRIELIIEKQKMFTRLNAQLNERQKKVLLRIFAEGIDGFKGGLSAENYIAITKTSKPTATRDLQDLVQKGALIKTGKLRYTRYYLNIPQIQQNPV